MNKQLIYVPIEPLNERYTSQWFRRFPQAFVAAGFESETIQGKPLLEDEIRVGAFLDINSTVAYKMSQLQTIAQMFHLGLVREDAIFFFGDIEFWGLESVRLMADMNGLKDVKITGFLHAASYTIEDAFAIAAPYQKYTEMGWLAALDKVFVGSEYHKQAVIDRRINNLVELMGKEMISLRNKLVVTKNPLFPDEYHDFGKVPKQKKILLANRFDPEKRPGETLKLFQRLHEHFPEWQFVVCTGRKGIFGHTADHDLLQKLKDQGIVQVKAGLTKAQYHRELAESYLVVTHSIEENYGYIIAEAQHYGCHVVAREGLSHAEFDGIYQFKDLTNGPDSDLAAAEDLMNAFDTPPPTGVPDYRGLENIINELKSL